MSTAFHVPGSDRGVEVDHRDGGFTLVEVTITILITGILVSALAMAITMAVRVSPDSEDRIDDARSTRFLSTWLAQDTVSTPPFLPEEAVGGFNLTAADDGTNNECAAAGSNVVHLRWQETTTTTVTYVANYRFVVEDGVGKVWRYTCRSADGVTFDSVSGRSMTPDLDPSQTPTASVTTDPISGDVTVLSFQLTGVGGETVLIETSSRNPSEYFP